MNELVELAGELEPIRNSLILTGLTLRTRSAIDADWAAPLARFVHAAVPSRSPLKLAGPEVTVNVALTLSPGATGPGIVSAPPWTTERHCGPGRERLSLTFVAGAPLVFVNVTTVSSLDPGA